MLKRLLQRWLGILTKKQQAQIIEDLAYSALIEILSRENRPISSRQIEEVAREFRRHIISFAQRETELQLSKRLDNEAFLDSFIDRINRKQLHK